MLRFTKLLIKVMLYSIIFCGLLFSISLAQTYTGHGVILDETTGLPLPTAQVTGGSVYCVIKDGSGGWVIGGDFTTVGGVARNGLAHLLSDGSLDAGWVANVSGGMSRVYAMAKVLYASEIFVGGNFTAINGTARNNIAKLNLTDGSVQSWYPAGGVDGTVFAIADRNSNAVVGGLFNYGAYSNLIDINSTATWISPMGNPNNAVRALAIMNAGGNFSNAYLYVGGDYTVIFGTPLNRICRIFRDFEMGWGYGGIYGEWYPTGGADGSVRALTLAGEGSPWEFSVIAGGDFTTIGGVPRNRLAALNFFTASVETWDPDVTGGPNASVYAVASTGQIVYAGGDFWTVGGTHRQFLAAISTATGLVTAWDPSPDDVVRAVAVGSVFAGGDFDNMGSPPVPVELSSLTVSCKHREVILNWQTKTEVNTSMFQIERASSSQNWIKVGEVAASGNSNSVKEYSYTDKKLQSGKYSYRLKMVDNDGSYRYSDAVEAEVALPKDYAISQNYPNPFNPSTRIDYQLPFDSKVTLELYGITGEKVASIINSELSAGYYTADINASAMNLASGVYIYRMNAQNPSGQNFVQVRKLMLTK